jgi:hypothetical protein
MATLLGEELGAIVVVMTVLEGTIVVVENVVLVPAAGVIGEKADAEVVMAVAGRTIADPVDVIVVGVGVVTDEEIGNADVCVVVVVTGVETTVPAGIVWVWEKAGVVAVEVGESIGFDVETWVVAVGTETGVRTEVTGAD